MSNPDSEFLVDARPLLKALRGMKRGDFSVRMPLDATGLSGEVSEAFNDLAELNARLLNELERIGNVVGREGKIANRAQLGDAGGSWADAVNAVNGLVGDLVRPTTEVARVIGSVAKGDLSQTMALEIEGSPLMGEFLRTANTINTMVEQLSSFASEVTRVAKEVGTEGKLGGQAQVSGVSGTWKDLTENVNSMAGNLTAQVRNIAEVTTAVATGDLSKKITVDVKGEILELKNTINTMVDQLGLFASEVTRVAREVGTDGKLGGQAKVRGVAGTWKDLTDNVNSMAGNLTNQVRNIAEVTTAVANGDLSKKITVDANGEILELKNTINTMVDQLSSFASEVTRVAREVGTEGKLGGQAQVSGIGGIWKDLTDNVNSMAGNLTGQVRGIAAVVTAVANGDLKRKLVLTAKGEIAALADTINEMIDTLATFADQVTTVAREVGVEGKLGGQAKVPGAAGTWRDLTDNVNQLAANLTTQVRAIADVATAVTKGDLTRSISVEALGEVASLKDNINEMIFNLKDTTRKNTEQDWLKTNLTKFTRMLQGQRDLLTVANLILSEVSHLVSAQQGVFYICDHGGTDDDLRLIGSYAHRNPQHLVDRFRMGESLIGQCALERKRLLLQQVPDNYVQITSGLGESSPRNIIVLPVLFEGQVRAVIELASLHAFSDVHLNLLDQLTESIGIVLNTIEANSRTEDLLRQSQSLAQELQSQQQELTETNKRLELQANTSA
jgi:HAMP domain-containing protein